MTIRKGRTKRKGGLFSNRGIPIVTKQETERHFRADNTFYDNLKLALVEGNKILNVNSLNRNHMMRVQECINSLGKTEETFLRHIADTDKALVTTTTTTTNNDNNNNDNNDNNNENNNNNNDNNNDCHTKT